MKNCLSLNMENLKKDILERFKEVVFDEKTHTYKANNTKFKYSVSQYIHKFSKPFDSETVASYVALKQGVSKQSVLNQWESVKDEACTLGTNTHLFGELYPFDRSLKPKNKFEEAVVKFWEELPEFIIPCIMELRLFCKSKLIAGTLDILLYNKKSNKFIIADYKTNKDLFKNYKCQKLLKPFNNLLDTPFNKYQLQLSLYKLVFENATGFEVERTRIVWLKPDGNYSLYDTENLTEELENTFKK